MPKESVSLDEVIAILNEAGSLDPEAIGRLVAERKLCNKALADHATIYVSKDTRVHYSIGALGLLNGIFGLPEDKEGAISANFDDDGRLVDFARTSDRPVFADSSN